MVVMKTIDGGCEGVRSGTVGVVMVAMKTISLMVDVRVVGVVMVVIKTIDGGYEGASSGTVGVAMVAMKSISLMERVLMKMVVSTSFSILQISKLNTVIVNTGDGRGTSEVKRYD